MTEPTTAISLIQALGALVFVIGLILAASYVLRRFAFGGALQLASKKAKRLQLVEQLWLDARYRLVIVQQDGREVTLLLGPDQALQINPALQNLPSTAKLAHDLADQA